MTSYELARELAEAKVAVGRAHTPKFRELKARRVALLTILWLAISGEIAFDANHAAAITLLRAAESEERAFYHPIFGDPTHYSPEEANEAARDFARIHD